MRLIKKYLKSMEKKEIDSDSRSSYFINARSWADDIYTETVATCNRYRLALIWLAVMIIGLLLLLIILLPLRHTDLIVVHRSDDGTVWVEPLHQSYFPKNKAQVESDIVRYVENRESYSISSYRVQYDLVNLLSSPSVAEEYIKSQSVSNQTSVVNQLGKRKVRTVHIENIIFLNRAPKDKKHQKNKNNLAQVNFTMSVRDKWTGKVSKKPFLALIAWQYLGTPKDPESKWKNWDGFTVIRYTVEQRNV